MSVDQPGQRRAEDDFSTDSAKSSDDKEGKPVEVTKNSIPSWILGVLVIMLCAMRVFSN